LSNLESTQKGVTNKRRRNKAEEVGGGKGGGKHRKSSGLVKITEEVTRMDGANQKLVRNVLP